MDNQHAAYRLPVSFIVLAGGKSSRMGKDKLGMAINGHSLLERAVLSASEISDDVLISINSEQNCVPEYSEKLPHSVRYIRDEESSQGPLSGIMSALPHCENAYAFVVAGDMPFLDNDLFRLLYDLKGDYDCVVPRLRRGIEPLCALYRCVPFIDAGERQLKTGENRCIRDVIDVLNCLYVELENKLDSKKAMACVTNVNTPQDYQQALDMFQKTVDAAIDEP